MIEMPGDIEQTLKDEFTNLTSEKSHLPTQIGSIVLLSGESLDSTNVGHEDDGDTERRFELALRLFFEKTPSPLFVIDGNDEQNRHLKLMTREKGIPDEKVFIIHNLVSNTLIQIKSISERNLDEPLVFVSDLVHIPRVRRYVKKWLPDLEFYYDSTEFPLNSDQVQEEIAKIVKYAGLGDLTI